MDNSTAIIIGILMLLVVGGFVFYAMRGNNTPQPQPIVVQPIVQPQPGPYAYGYRDNWYNRWARRWRW